MNGELAVCPCCGEDIIVLPDGQVTTPEVVAAVIERYEEVLDWREALADDERRAVLAQWLPEDQLGAAFTLLDGLGEAGDG